MSERNYIYVTNIESIYEDFILQGKTEEEFNKFLEQFKEETDLGVNGVIKFSDETFITGEETAKCYNELFSIEFAPQTIGN